MFKGKCNTCGEKGHNNSINSINNNNNSGSGNSNNKEVSNTNVEFVSCSVNFFEGANIASAREELGAIDNGIKSLVDDIIDAVALRIVPGREAYLQGLNHLCKIQFNLVCSIH